MVLTILRSRKFARRTLLGILIIIIPAFVFWGAGSIANRPEPVGKIFGRAISAEDFIKSQQAVRIQILLNYFDNYAAMNRIIRNRSLVNSMAWERLILLNAARREKIKVSNSDVMAFIALHPLFQRGGSFDRETYSSLLRNPLLSMSPREFEELVRQNLEVRSYRDIILRDMEVSEEDILEEFSRNNDKVSISYFLIDKDVFAGGLDVSEEEVLAAYTRNSNKFFSPEKISIEYLEFSYGSPAEKNAVMAIIEGIYDELGDGPDSFAAAAGKKGIRHGETGFFSRNDVIPGVVFFREFHEAVFALEKGQISIPLFSGPERGIAYVARKTASIEPAPLAFDEVREDLAQALIDVKAIEMARDEAEQAYREISEYSFTLEETAGERDVEIRTASLIGVEDYIEQVGAARNIVLAARLSEKGTTLEPMVSPKGALIIRVDDIVPADISSLSREQREQLRQTLASHEQLERMDAWFRERASDIELFAPLREL